MMVLWEAAEPVPRSYIDEKLKGKQNWASTTVLNFLARLADKGFVLSEQQGHARSNLYSALISEQEYLEYESSSVMGRLCSRSVKDLVANLYRNQSIDEKELDELEAFIQQTKKEK